MMTSTAAASGESSASPTRCVAGQHAHLGVDGGKSCPRRIDLRLSDDAGIEQGLAGEVGEIDAIGVDQGQRAYAGGGEKLRHRIAQAADTDDERMRLGEALLGVDAELGKQDVPAVAQQLRVIHWPGGCLGRLRARVGSHGTL